jgi:hypothetical protein
MFQKLSKMAYHEEQEVLGAFPDKTRATRKPMCPTILLLLCIPCCRNIFTDLLPRNYRGIHIQTHRKSRLKTGNVGGTDFLVVQPNVKIRI